MSRDAYAPPKRPTKRLSIMGPSHSWHRVIYLDGARIGRAVYHKSTEGAWGGRPTYWDFISEDPRFDTKGFKRRDEMSQYIMERADK